MTVKTKISYISENYSMLHGLKAVPIGLVLFLVSLWANNAHGPVTNLFLPITFALSTLLLSMSIEKYYKSNFGEVKPKHADHRRYWITQAALGLLGFFVCWVDLTFHLPVSFIGLGVASVFLFDKPKVKFPLDNFSMIKLIAAICMLFVSVSPFFFGRNWWHVFGVHGTILGIAMFASILTIIQGVIWHIFFIKSLPAIGANDE